MINNVEAFAQVARTKIGPRAVHFVNWFADYADAASIVPIIHTVEELQTLHGLSGMSRERMWEQPVEIDLRIPYHEAHLQHYKDLKPARLGQGMIFRAKTEWADQTVRLRMNMNSKAAKMRDPLAKDHDVIPKGHWSLNGEGTLPNAPMSFARLAGLIAEVNTALRQPLDPH